MKLFAICLVYTILITAMCLRFKEKAIVKAVKKKKVKDLKWVDELINNTLKIKQ